MPPGCRKEITPKGEVPLCLKLARVPRCDWLFRDSNTPRNCETMLYAMATGLQRHLPGKFTGPNELRRALHHHTLNHMSDAEFSAFFPGCKGVRSDRVSYANFLAGRCTGSCVDRFGPPDIPVPGDIQVLIHYLHIQTPFSGHVYSFNVRYRTLTRVGEHQIELATESSIALTDIVLVDLWENRWIAGETRRGTTQLW